MQLLNHRIPVPDEVRWDAGHAFYETAYVHERANLYLRDLERVRPELEVIGTQLGVEVLGGRMGALPTSTGGWLLTITVRVPAEEAAPRTQLDGQVTVGP